MIAQNERETQELSLLESLDAEWIKLPLAVMQDVGPAAQTLGGLLKLTNRETFSAVGEIAIRSRLPVATVRKHLVTLDAHGWINHHGREKTRRGWLRRTATLTIMKKTTLALDGQASENLNPNGKPKLLYGVLPWWACCQIKKVGKLPWCSKAVLSIVMGRLAALKAAGQRQGDHDGDEELIGALENLGGDDRFKFPLRWLMAQTGLTHDSITTAKRLLHYQFHILRWIGTERPKGRFKPGTTPETDLLAPNWRFARSSRRHRLAMSGSTFRGTRKVVNRYAKTGQYRRRKLGNGGTRKVVNRYAKTGHPSYL